MGVASSILALVSFVFLVGGLVTSLVPYVGSVLSFGAPVVALFGIVLGGVGMSRAKQMGDSDTFATLGLTLNVLAFVIGLLFALTCGVCNACMSQAQQQNARWNLGPTPGSTTPPGPPPTTGPTSVTPGSSSFTPPPIGPSVSTGTAGATDPLDPWDGVTSAMNGNGTTGGTDPLDPWDGVTAGMADRSRVLDPWADDDPASCRAAEACCRAFFDDPSACDEVLAAVRASSDPGAECARMAREYRTGLARLDRPVPAACNP